MPAAFDRLVIVRAGPESRHAQWLQPERKFGLWLVAEPGLPLSPLPSDVRVFDAPAEAGAWAAMQAVLAATVEDWRACAHVFFAADDLEASPAAIDQTFALAARHGLALAQPALGWASHFAGALALHNPSFQLRHVNQVDPAALCFAAPFLREVLPLLAFDPLGQAIGRVLPSVTPDPLRRAAVLDAVQVLRTREPQPAELHPQAQAMLGEFNQVEPAEYSWSGIDHDGKALSLFDPTRDHFLGRLVSGWAQAVQEPAVLGEVFLQHLQRSAAPAPAGSGTAAPPKPRPALALRRSPVVARSA